MRMDPIGRIEGGGAARGPTSYGVEDSRTAAAEAVDLAAAGADSAASVVEGGRSEAEGPEAGGDHCVRKRGLTIWENPWP